MRDRPLILVVDDIEENIEIVRVRLEAQGYEIETAGNGREAIEKADRLRPDLILLDIMMPGMDGFEVLSRLKRLPDGGRIPVMVLTGYSDAVSRARDAGAREVLLKPFEKNAFVRKVLQLLQGAHAPAA